jgi:hypothetical protein
MNTFLKETNELYKTTFNKEQYLEWKETWKEHYKELSQTIREGKAKRKDVPYGYVQGLLTLRYLASTMMEMHTNMKEKAKELKEATNGKNVL